MQYFCFEVMIGLEVEVEVHDQNYLILMEVEEVEVEVNNLDLLTDEVDCFLDLLMEVEEEAI